MRLDEDIGQAGPDQLEIIDGAAGDKARHVAGMLDGYILGDGRGQQFARALGLNLAVGVEEDAGDTGGQGQAADQRRIDPPGHDKPAHQRCHDIVPGRRIGRDFLAFHRQGQEVGQAEGRSQERIHGTCRRDRGGCRATHAGAERNTLVDVDDDPERCPGRLQDGVGGGQRAIVPDGGRQGFDEA